MDKMLAQKLCAHILSWRDSLTVNMTSTYVTFMTRHPNRGRAFEDKWVMTHVCLSLVACERVLWLCQGTWACSSASTYKRCAYCFESISSWMNVAIFYVRVTHLKSEPIRTNLKRCKSIVAARCRAAKLMFSSVTVSTPSAFVSNTGISAAWNGIRRFSFSTSITLKVAPGGNTCKD